MKTENTLVVDRAGGGEVGEMGKDCQKVPTSSYKISKFWGCNVQHKDHC